MAIDISKIKFDSTGYFELLAKSLQEFVVVIDPVEFRIKFINHILPEFRMEDVIGSTVFNFVLPEHHDIYRQKLAKVASEGVPEYYELEGQSTLYESGKAWYFSTIVPFMNNKAEVESIAIISKDITFEKLQAKMIEDKHQELLSIINNTQDIIVSIDRNYSITEYNKTFEDLVKSGYQVNKIKGTNILKYIDETRHSRLKEIYRKVLGGEIVYDVENYKLKSGGLMVTETNYNPIFDHTGVISGITIYSKDITKRVQDEKVLLNSLKEREMLLFEIHHRIKNNLALINSMLELKELNLNDPEAKEVLKESRERIKTTALVHERLYSNANFNQINVNTYLIELFNYIRKNSEQSIRLNGGSLLLDIKKAFPFGLLMHELMMNSVKHSLGDSEKAYISLNIDVQDSNVKILYIESNGSFPEEIDLNSSHSTGLMLINTFTEQLNGKIVLLERSPTTYQIMFPLNEQ
ncbi:MAG: sensor histidine kinase [Bacteroidia bacterium]